MWLLLLVTLGAANAAVAFGLVRTERTRGLALWGLVLKVCFLPIFLVSLVVFALIVSQFSLRPEALPLEFALLTPYAVLSYALMIVTSCYGFAAIIRARDEQVISPETAKKYKRWHAIPIADLVASIRLYLLLRRPDRAAGDNAQDANQFSRAYSAAQPVSRIGNSVADRPPTVHRAARIPWPAVAPLTASFCFVATAYAGGPLTMVFYPPYPTLRIDVWPLAILVCAAASVVYTHISRDRRKPRELAFWGLVIKLSLLPFFLITCLLTFFLGAYLFAPGGPAPQAFILPFVLLGAYAIMIVTSSHGFAAIIRARDEQVISPETAKTYKRWHAIPIADLVSSIRLYMLLRRLDSSALASAQDA
ncbi:hypothetical protein [Actinomyces sp.]